MDAASFFPYALIGALVGFILGDFQREVRIRRTVRANLHRPLYGHTVPDTNTGPFPVTVADLGPLPDSAADSYGDADGGPAWTLRSVRDGQARRLAVPGDNDRARAAAAVRRGNTRGSTPTPVSAGYDCG